MSIRENTVLAPSLDYKKLEFSGSTLGYRKVFPNDPSDFVINPTSITEQFIEIPSEKVANLSKSMLVWNSSTAAGGGGRFNYLYEDCISQIGEIDMTTEAGTKLMQLRYAQNFTHMVRKVMTSFSEFESLDKVGRLYKSNALVTAVGAIRPIGGAASLNYIENSYVKTITVNTAITQYSMIPLSAYKHNITVIDKLLYFGEKVTIRLGFGPGVKVGFTSDSGTDPASNSAALAVDTTISGLCLYLATEEDPAIVNKVKEQVQKNGLKVLCPMVTGYRKNFAASTNQIASYTFMPNFQRAKYLQRVYHAVYSATESSNSAYDHSNVNASKVTSYATYLNGDKRVQFDTTCTTASLGDYMLNQRFMKGTAITDSTVYQYNWLHIDDFTNFPTVGDAPSPAPLENQMAGLPFAPDIKWEANLNTANTSFNHYTYIVTLGILNISPGATQWE